MRRPDRIAFLAISLLGVIFWGYWTTLVEMAERWTDDPQYSHGYLVPLFSVYLLWSRRAMLKDARFSPSWWGVAILLVGIAIRAVGTWFFYGFLDAFSLLF